MLDVSSRYSLLLDAILRDPRGPRGCSSESQEKALLRGVLRREYECLRRSILRYRYFSWEVTNSNSESRLSSSLNWVEAFLGLYLDFFFPGNWAYNGQAQKGVVIGGRIPDFVCLTNPRFLIEVFSFYYHNEEGAGLLISYYKSLGWDCIVIWDNEVYTLPDLGLVLSSSFS